MGLDRIDRLSSYRALVSVGVFATSGTADRLRHPQDRWPASLHPDAIGWVGSRADRGRGNRYRVVRPSESRLMMWTCSELWLVR
jgi:hypothetical protein